MPLLFFRKKGEHKYEEVPVIKTLKDYQNDRQLKQSGLFSRLEAMFRKLCGKHRCSS